jgi:hypothetical protein
LAYEITFLTVCLNVWFVSAPNGMSEPIFMQLGKHVMRIEAILMT